MPKQFFTYEQQLNKLKNEKQLTISNPAYAEEVLEKLGYYSLIGGYKNLSKRNASEIERLVKSLNKTVSLPSNYAYITHHAKVYGNVPLWVAMNALTFG